MKTRLCLVATTGTLALGLAGADRRDAQRDATTREIDAAVAELYDVISGPAGAPRDWAQFEGLFQDEAKLVSMAPTLPADEADPGVAIMTPAGYIEHAAPILLERGFFEEETASKTEVFGRLAHRWSTYVARQTEDGDVFMRGINSIQLIKTADGWKVLSIAWTPESDKNPIPEQYLPED